MTIDYKCKNSLSLEYGTVNSNFLGCYCYEDPNGFDDWDGIS